MAVQMVGVGLGKQVDRTWGAAWCRGQGQKTGPGPPGCQVSLPLKETPF